MWTWGGGCLNCSAASSGSARPAGIVPSQFREANGLAAIEASIGRFEAAHRAATDKGDAQAAAAALREVRYWRARRASAEVVRPSSDTRTASFGMTVALRREPSWPVS
jgi:hypothetical protein